VTEGLILASYPVFRFHPEKLFASDRDVAAKEVGALLDEWTERVSVRGIYSLAGFRADADLMMWWIANSPDDVQDLLVALRKTTLGGALEVRDALLGVVRPAEFSPNHLPAFVKGEEPKKYACVYPFVRTPEWYLLDPKDRGAMLRDHGRAGREYPDVLANTTSAFGLGDYEWILCFEADGIERIVELIRHLRATEARRYTKVEVPFYTGIRKDLDAAIADLP
jgi:hydrogen peroxide-dependent heme synthase